MPDRIQEIADNLYRVFGVPQSPGIGIAKWIADLMDARECLEREVARLREQQRKGRDND